MDYLVNLITYLFSFLITFPFLLTFGIYGITRMISLSSTKAFHKALDWSTSFYILSVYFLKNMYMIDFPLFSFITIALLLLMSGILIYQRQKHLEIIVIKAAKIVWRLCFLLFSNLYVIFMIYGIMLFIRY